MALLGGYGNSRPDGGGKGNQQDGQGSFHSTYLSMSLGRRWLGAEAGLVLLAGDAVVSRIKPLTPRARSPGPSSDTKFRF